MNLAGTTFRAVANSENGSLNTQTEMRFTRDDGIVVASYTAARSRSDTSSGTRLGEDELDMLYQGATTAGDVQAGTAHATFSLDEDGRMRMHLEWRWLTGDGSAGRSEWEQV